MERESFEEGSAAQYMNSHFVNIKVDREERPDLDHIYMDAVQAMAGSGGWPLNVFLTPDARPFYGGTYFPPVRAYNRASWKEVMQGVVKAFRENREQVEEQARQLTDHLRQANSFGTQALDIQIPFVEKFTASQMEMAFQQAMGQADRVWGGFGKAPKFPQTFTINFLLRFFHFTGNREAKDQACLSLDKMIMGGIFDHIGGGFARYSTDGEWLAPHFEKMLYDNALLVLTLCDAFQLTANPVYEKTIRETLRFIETALMGEEGGFYSALDADSEGVEGKYYVWTLEEVQEVLGEDADWFSSIYDITDKGNWEHVSIPRLLKWPEDIEGFDPERLEKCRAALEHRRSERVRPGLDDKILTGWNALMNLAFTRAAGMLDDAHYRQVAVKNMEFLLKNREDHGKLKHTYKNGVYRVEAFLDDHAYLINALLGIMELTGENRFLDLAAAVLEEVVDAFSDEDNLFFYYTKAGQQDVIVRKKEIYDGATPSGNAIIAGCLWRMGILLDRVEWRQRAISMAEGVGQMASRYPTSFGVWTDMILQFVNGTCEIAVVGKEAGSITRELLKAYIPYRVMQSAGVGNQPYPLLINKEVEGDTLIYLCRDYSCRKPVKTIGELMQLIENGSASKSMAAQ
jgi:uncharacterized protein YyaL (SSP411 family)